MLRPGYAVEYDYADPTDLDHGLQHRSVPGLFLAGHWKRQGADSGAEFLEMRFGKSLVQFYTWLQGGIAIFTMGGAVYALSVIICALIPLSEGHLLADPMTERARGA